ncbi:MAG: hypothetical protein D8M59_15930 [Planctomycetes bacterium]|nr:hypothetical protein [Planctomycetota bacterium]NOG52773.1 hypothetical protein [Planctomycetota bacterium]
MSKRTSVARIHIDTGRPRTAGKVGLGAALAVAASVVVSSTTAAVGQEASFTGLGYLDGSAKLLGSQADGLSSDGSKIVGWSYVFDRNLGWPVAHGFVWSEATGMLDLGLADNGGLDSTGATAISDDGSIVAGQNGFTNNEGFYEIRNGMFWTDAMGGNPYGTVFNEMLAITDLTPDGNVMVGATRIPGPWPIIDSAFYYTQGGGLVELGYLPDGVYSAGEAVSADGSVIVGYGDGEGAIAAFRWTEATGVQYLTGQETGVYSQAFGITPDGNTIVGAYGLPYEEACYWNPDDEFVTIGTLPGSRKGYSLDVSADASTIVGYSWWDTGENEAFIWTQAGGLRSLKEVLTADYGLDLTGWTLRRATGISDDGSTICGWGTAPDGHIEGWKAVIPGDAVGLELAVVSECPNAGPGRVAWTGGTPGGRVALAFARTTGNFVVSNGPCADTVLGLSSLGLRLVFTSTSDASGNGSQGGNVPAAACGSYLQLIDLESCEVSNVVRIE